MPGLYKADVRINIRIEKNGRFVRNLIQRPAKICAHLGLAQKKNHISASHLQLNPSAKNVNLFLREPLD